MDPYNPIIAAHAAAQASRADGIEPFWDREAAAGPMGGATAAPGTRGRILGATARRPGPSRARPWLDRLAEAPGWVWLALHALASWPAFAWAARRMADGSDDPLGLIALGMLVAAAATGRLASRAAPRPGWLAAAMGITVGATALLGTVPPLAHALLAAVALACAWAAFRADRAPVLPVLGLLWLALPLIASLQFYAGFPLRVATAWLSAGLLQAAGVAAEAAGASVAIGGRLVLVDAPCSGVQLAWFAYASACGAALWHAVPDGRFIRRLAMVGAAALLGNVLRNTLLLAAEGGVVSWPAWSHDAVGLAVLIAVCALSAWWMAPAKEGGAAGAPSRRGPPDERRARAPRRTAIASTHLGSPDAAHGPSRIAEVARRWTAMRGSSLTTLSSGAVVAALVGCALAALAMPPRPVAPAGIEAEGPTSWDGRPLRPLALGEVERRFAARFPGTVARLSNGRQEVVWRHVTEPTRMLHPAADCYRGAGFRVAGERVETDADRRQWRCFDAEPSRPGEPVLRVCERITDAQGRSWTDSSSWFWAALLGRTEGPWEAVTTAQAR